MVTMTALTILAKLTTHSQEIRSSALGNVQMIERTAPRNVNAIVQVLCSVIVFIIILNVSTWLPITKIRNSICAAPNTSFPTRAQTRLLCALMPPRGARSSSPASAMLCTKGYLSLKEPRTEPVYVARIPKPRIMITPGIRPVTASTEGRERIPREMVSAIMSILHCHHARERYFLLAETDVSKGFVGERGVAEVDGEAAVSSEEVGSRSETDVIVTIVVSELTIAEAVGGRASAWGKGEAMVGWRRMAWINEKVGERGSKGLKAASLKTWVDI